MVVYMINRCCRTTNDSIGESASKVAMPYRDSASDTDDKPRMLRRLSAVLSSITEMGFTAPELDTCSKSSVLA